MVVLAFVAVRLVVVLLMKFVVVAKRLVEVTLVPDKVVKVVAPERAPPVSKR